MNPIRDYKEVLIVAVIAIAFIAAFVLGVNIFINFIETLVFGALY